MECSSVGAWQNLQGGLTWVTVPLEPLCPLAFTLTWLLLFEVTSLDVLRVVLDVASWEVLESRPSWRLLPLPLPWEVLLLLPRASWEALES